MYDVDFTNTQTAKSIIMSCMASARVPQCRNGTGFYFRILAICYASSTQRLFITLYSNDNNSARTTTMVSREKNSKIKNI